MKAAAVRRDRTWMYIQKEVQWFSWKCISILILSTETIINDSLIYIVLVVRVLLVLIKKIRGCILCYIDKSTTESKLTHMFAMCLDLRPILSVHNIGPGFQIVNFKLFTTPWSTFVQIIQTVERFLICGTRTQSDLHWQWIGTCHGTIQTKSFLLFQEIQQFIDH